VDLYEHQGKELLARQGLSIPRGIVATTPEEAALAAGGLGGPMVVKAQVHTGGRGKAGGVAVVADAAAAREAAARILGMDIRGRVVRRVLVEEASAIERELYAAVVLDRAAKQPLVMLSAVGGMEVEELAARHPGAIARLHVDPLVGWKPFMGRRLAFAAGVDGSLLGAVGEVLACLYATFVREEATLVEVNPLALTTDGRLVVVDAKVTIDNSALFRHPDAAAMRDVAAADPQETMAQERGVTYVKLEGDIGVLGNGAGLVMSTLDVVGAAGGRPADFLDIGGGAKAEEIVSALQVVTSDPEVRVVLLNIFGGITRCDEVARGILAAVEQLGLTLPIVVRLDGTNEVEGRALLARAALGHVVVEATMQYAARRAVALAASAPPSAATGAGAAGGQAPMTRGR
jgi:succinyl-CoA synthetase beta subunit